MCSLYFNVEWTKAIQKKLNSFERWLYRRILRISYVDRVTNKTILEKMKMGKEMMNIIKRRKLEYLGYNNEK